MFRSHRLAVDFTLMVCEIVVTIKRTLLGAASDKL